ncbi:MAG: VWA domain-containing protein [Pseudomonadota bacterium]
MALLTSLIVPDIAGAAGSLFSRVRGANFDMPANLASQTGLVDTGVIPLSADGTPLNFASSNQAIFDITVSIYRSVAGDNDATTDAGASDDDQNAYETIFGFAADSICEQTNGVHKLGRVRISTNGASAATSDIKWDNTGRPAANPTGFGKDGWRIYMFDNFGGIRVSDGGDDLEDLGYIVGHEWGHYTLGLYDEYREPGQTSGDPYQPLDSDVAVQESIMSSTYEAVDNDDFRWLNHSTQNNIGNIAETAQGRVYGKSGWETLIQTTNNDPTTVNAWNAPSRTHYTNLVGAEPTAADNWFRLQLPGGQTDCRSELQILWVDEIELELVLDSSGSMSGTPIDSARSAAQVVIDLLEDGSSAAGVSAFDSSVDNVAAVTPIPDPGTAEKNALKAAIAGISAGGSTAVFDGAVFGLNKLIDFANTNNTSASQILFLLSDGGDNASTETAASTVAAFNAANVPIISFGYGNAFDQTLPDLAAQTGGLFFQSPTTAAEIQNAFTQAFAAVSGAQPLGGTTTAAPTQTQTEVPFAIDSTIESLVIGVSWNGADTDFARQVQDANGNNTGVQFDCTVTGSAVSCLAEIDAATIQSLGLGSYTVVTTNQTGFDLNHSINVTANPIEGLIGGTFALRADSRNGATINYPEPILISAIVSRDLPITGAEVVAKITDQNGLETDVDLNDDGVGADQFSGDGYYSGWAPYTAGNGNYTIEIVASNPNGTAQFSTSGLTQAHYGAPLREGEQATTPTLSSENFTRSTSLQVAVANSQFDDHADAPEFPQFCTELSGDNVGVDIRTDFAGDADCFRLNPETVDTDVPLTIRVFNNALGADPMFTVFDATGTTVIAEVDPASVEASTGSLNVMLAQADVDPNGLVIVTSDMDDQIIGSSYSISSGPELSSDIDLVTDDDSGGAFGPFGLALLALFAALASVLRRRAAV